MNKTWYLISSILLIAILSCGNNNIKNANNDKKQSSPDTIICNQNYDALLIKYANSFAAKEINLSENISIETSDFLAKIDTNCFRKQTKHGYFISVILAKLYLHHLMCCNQGYDLLSMKKGGAGVVINEFERMAGYQNKSLEMLNSGTIVDFIAQSPKLKTEADLNTLLLKIKKEQNRIEQTSIKR